MTAVDRAVVLTGTFPAEAGHLVAAAGALRHLTVYGAAVRLPGASHEARPPEGMPSRAFVPIGPRAKGHLWWRYRGLERALDEDRPEVIHVVSEPWGLLANQAATWARRHREVALVIHGCDRIWWHGNRPERLLRRWMAHRALRRADGYLAETGAAIERAREVGLAPDAEVGIVHTNPRDPQVYRPAGSAAERRAARSRLDLPLDGTGVGFVGRLVPEKGPLVFLDAVQAIRDRGAGGGRWFAIAGSGPLEQQVRLRCRAAGVHFLGMVEQPTMSSELFRSLDVVTVPSYRTPSWDDQSPRVVIEALLSGCTVIGSDSGAIPDMLGGQGVVVPERDVDALASAIEALPSADQLRSNSVAGRGHAERRYSTGAAADLLVRHWVRALERRQTSRQDH